MYIGHGVLMGMLSATHVFLRSRPSCENFCKISKVRKKILSNRESLGEGQAKGGVFEARYGLTPGEPVISCVFCCASSAFFAKSGN